MSVRPPLFGSAIPRQCTRWLGGRNCGKTPVMHVAWLVDDEGVDAGFVCGEHAGELGTVWDFVQKHEPGADCGMPGAAWFFGENVCRCEGQIKAAPLRERVLAEGRTEH